MRTVSLVLALGLLALAACVEPPSVRPSSRGDLRLAIPAGESLRQTEFDFGALKIGSSKEVVITASNAGRDSLTVTNQKFEAATSGAFFVKNVPSLLEPATSVAFTATFSPPAAGPLEARLALEHDGETQTATITFRGTGVQ
jgi:hypothetical protein